MEHPKGKPMVVPANEGRKMIALGNEVRLKLSSSGTGGDLYVFEILTPPGVVVPPHVHRHSGHHRFFFSNHRNRRRPPATKNTMRTQWLTPRTSGKVIFPRFPQRRSVSFNVG